MSDKKRIILLSIISVLIVTLFVAGATYAYLKAGVTSSSVTKVDVTTCAKISLDDTSGSLINLTNTYPMTDIKGKATTAYNFKVKSTCATNVKFKIYVATLTTNTLAINNVKYYLKNNTANTESLALLNTATELSSDFNASEIEQLNSGISGTKSGVYKIYEGTLNGNSEVSFSLNMWVDGNAGADSMNKTFKAGIATKSFPV
ncbi:MAG: hypothetical protein RSE17_02090 [Bacilli bacterium]